MKILFILSLFLIVANCTANSVKIGKRCTIAGVDGSFEKCRKWVACARLPTLYLLFDSDHRQAQPTGPQDLSQTMPHLPKVMEP